MQARQIRMFVASIGILATSGCAGSRATVNDARLNTSGRGSADAPGLGQSGDPRATRMDAVFSAFRGDSTPGCAAGASQDGRWLHARGYGMASLEHGVPITPTTVFNSGSLSKQFTALSIVLLAEQGRLSLDHVASRYLPELASAGTGITIRQMLQHTSGLREKWDLLELRGARDGELVTQADVLSLVAAQRELSFRPGSDFIYNNTAYDLLATIVARVGGVPLREFAARNIFRPLGMQQTTYVDDRGAIVRNRATGYWWPAAARRVFMPNTETVGSGGLHTTLEDLARYEASFFGGKLGHDIVAKLTTPGRLDDGTELDYALGLVVDRWRGLTRIRHGGAIAGFKAELMRFPAKRFSAIVLCNFAQAAPQRLAERIAEIFLDGQLDSISRTAAPPGPRAFGDRSLAARAAGTYRQEQGGFLLRLVADGDGLNYSVGSVHIPLVASGPLKASAPCCPGAELEFEAEDGGRITGLRVAWPGFLPGRYDRATPAPPIGRMSAGLAGTYVSPELQVAWTLEVRGDSVHFVSPSGRRVALIPVAGDGLATVDGGWITTLRRNPLGSVDTLLLTMGRSRGIRFERR